jgi:heat shock protein HslJ
MTESPAAGLDGTTYVSTIVEGHDLVDGSTIRLSFEDGRLAAVAGCNTMSASYAVTDGRLAWTGPPMATRMACPEDLMTQDGWLSGLLSDGVDVTLDGDDLALVAGDVTLHLGRVEG